MDDTKGVVAVRDGVDEHPNREQVVNLLVGLLALLHLLVDRPQVLRTSRHLHITDPRLLELFLQRITQGRDERFTLAALLRHLLRQQLVFVTLEMLEREILELPAHLGHAEAVREGSVEIARLLGNAVLPVERQEFQRSHVVQPIRELHDDDARILGDGQQQLAIALDLPLLIRSAVRQLRDLRQAVHDRRDLAAEFLLDLRDVELRVLDDVVDQATRDGGRVELQLGEDLRDLHAVRDVGLTRIPELAAMRGLAEPVGTREHVLVETTVGGVVEEPAGNDLVQRRRRHSRPVSAKLVYRPRPMMT